MEGWSNGEAPRSPKWETPAYREGKGWGPGYGGHSVGQGAPRHSYVRGSFVTVSFKFEAISQVECGLHTAGVDGTRSLLCDFDAKLTWRAARLTEKAARRPLELGWWPSFHPP